MIAGFSFGNGLMTYFSSGGISQLFSMFDCLVIQTHLPLINVNVPASASVFYSFLFEIAKFDIVPEIDSIYVWMFGETDSSPLNINFEALGYES